jgi:alkylation response protein AidB-like acyl-CoA dehydrogenase
LEALFSKTVEQMRMLKLITQSDFELFNKVDSACEELVTSEYEHYIAREYNDQTPVILSKHDLMGLPIDRKYGGHSVSPLVHALTMERFGQLGMGVVTLVDVHQFLGSLTIQNWATDDQKERILPKAARGESILAYALTEPEAGSDPASMTSTFERRGNKFILNGSKYLISNGSIARYVIVFARSSSDNLISAFIVDSKSSGYEVAMHLTEKLGLFTSDTALIEFHDIELEGDALLGKLGRGLAIAYSALLSGRIGIASGCIGVMEDCLNNCVERAKYRTQHSKPIGKHQLIQRHIAHIAANLEASRWPVYSAALMKHQMEMDPQNKELLTEVDRQSATAKLIASRNAFDTADRSVQVFGGFGYSILSPVGKHLLDSRVARIYEGTDEIMELKVASTILGKEYEAYR